MPANTTAPSFSFQLQRDARGRLVMHSKRGTYVGVVPVRAFPIGDPQRALALMDTQGHEVAWIDDPADLPADIRDLIQAELDTREFMPEIQRIVSVSSFATPSVWHVETNRGATQFTLKAEEDIRRLLETKLLITDSNGVHYLIPDLATLPRSSRRLLDRFL